MGSDLLSTEKLNGAPPIMDESKGHENRLYCLKSGV